VRRAHTKGDTEAKQLRQLVRRSGATLFFIIVSSALIGSGRNLLGMLLALIRFSGRIFCGRIRAVLRTIIIEVILAAVAFFIADRHLTEYKGCASVR
jgi:hypothetical protein